MDHESALAVATRELAQAALDATNPWSGASPVLERGEVPPDLAQKAIAFAQAHDKAVWAATPGVTAILASWRAARDALRASLGRDPSVRELGEAMGKSKTAAHFAVKRLRKLESGAKCNADATGAAQVGEIT